MLTETPEVDVAVVTWNTREVTLDALAALSGTEAPGRIRVLVRDNGSTDGTAEAIAARFPDVDLDAGADNLGFAGGVNTILQRGRAAWVLLLNSDAWPEPGAIGHLVACGERHPHAAAIAPRLLRPDDTLEPSTWPFPSLRVAIRAALRPVRYLWSHDRERSIDWAAGRSGSHPTPSYATSATRRDRSGTAPGNQRHGSRTRSSSTGVVIRRSRPARGRRSTR